MASAKQKGVMFCDVIEQEQECLSVTMLLVLTLIFFLFEIEKHEFFFVLFLCAQDTRENEYD